MKNYNNRYLSILLMVTTLLGVGCGQNMPPTNETQSPTAAKSEIADTPTSSPVQSTEEGIAVKISDQPYNPASGVFQVNLPENWNCSESGSFQVNCESPSSDALLQARITSTGYELTDEDLAAFTHAELVHRYGDIKEYAEIDKVEMPGKEISRATWREGTEYWESVDAFTRQGRGVFHITFAYMQAQSEKYSDLYNTIADSVKIFPEKLTNDAFYPFRKTVAARDAFFEIDVPTSWGRFIDISSVNKTIVEGYVSPDERASVQIAIYKQGTFIEKDAKANNTREIMFRLYGYDLVNLDDIPLPDGRERLPWYAARKDVYGVTDFDTYVNALFLFTITWEPSTASLYLPVLEEIQSSFNRE